MSLFVLIIITILSSAAYGAGIVDILKGKYKPNTFSRIIWLFLAINSFFGVLLGNSSTGSLVLASVLLAGNLVMALLSLKRGEKSFGTIEYISSFLLIISGVIWITVDAPYINLLISLGAHLIGALPTYKQVIKNPQSENKLLWLLFAIASLISLFTKNSSSFESITLPLYFLIFDGSVYLLTLRKTKKPTT